MKQTSLNAYRELQERGKHLTQMATIYEYILANGAATRRQIANDLEMDTSSVSGRVNDMLKTNAVFVSGKGTCPISKKTVEIIEVNV